MRIRYMSDLHLEGREGYRPVCMEEDLDSTLVLAGDIHTGSNAVPFLEGVCKRFKYVIYLFGNHEFYHHSIPEVRGVFNELKKRGKLPTNLHILDNTTVELDGITFIGSTLWTDMGHDPYVIHKAQHYMNDFRVIYRGVDRKSKFTPEGSMREHEAAIQFIESELKKDRKNVVICTHHLPSYSSVDHFYRSTSDMNSCFFSNLDWLMESYKPEYWIHGHTHTCVREVVDETIILCNPMGYGKENAQRFNPLEYFDIE